MGWAYTYSAGKSDSQKFVNYFDNYFVFGFFP